MQNESYPGDDEYFPYDPDELAPIEQPIRMHLAHEDSRVALQVDYERLKRIVSVMEAARNEVQKICHTHRVPIPARTDVILPEPAYEVLDVIVHGRRIPQPHATLYLRFYQGGPPSLLLVVPETGDEVEFDLDL